MSVGSYSKYRMVTNEDLEIFNEAKKDLIGVEYEALIVAQQVVSGINYKFVCNARLPHIPDSPYLATMTVYSPLPGQGAPEVIDIKRID